MDFLPGRQLREARAIGNVTLKTVTPTSERTMTAKDLVRVEYRNNAMERVTSEGEPVLEEQSQGLSRTARASRFEANYTQGRAQDDTG